MLYRITHTTQYTYTQAVSLCHNEAHLIPRDLGCQRCLTSDLVIDPSPKICCEREDFYGNRVVYFAVQKSHKVLRVTAKSEVERTTPPTLVAEQSPPWEQVKAHAQRDISLRPFVLDSPLIPMSSAWREYALKSFPAQQPLLVGVTDLMRRIYEEFKYQPGFTTVATPLSEVMEHRQGVCQDFAHLGLAFLRSLGLPSRYVSGYVLTHPPEGQERLVGADASHAWFAVYVPEFGWIDFDPTNNKLPAEQHVTLAWGRDYSDVPPLKGIILGGGPHRLAVSVDMRPEEEIQASE